MLSLLRRRPFQRFFFSDFFKNGLPVLGLRHGYDVTDPRTLGQEDSKGILKKEKIELPAEEAR